MAGVWGVIFSPLGIGLYALFWAFKLTVGAWVVRKIFVSLPTAAQDKLRNLINFRRSARSTQTEQGT